MCFVRLTAQPKVCRASSKMTGIFGNRWRIGRKPLGESQAVSNLAEASCECQLRMGTGDIKLRV